MQFWQREDDELSSKFGMETYVEMKRGNCPFCGHRWIRKAHESPIICPNCTRKYYSKEDLEERQKNKS